ncbi:MAG TPA: metalloregulator ArsR/SmtB family transcription factor [Euzebyales bacterium]|nr:metalloregulator ArsR/SmtB family transcription factor [Euzebyales bacterium]
MNERVDAVFDALGDPTRRRLFDAVAATGPVTATQLAGDLPVTRQAVAKHLAVLAGAGLVVATRSGRENRYEAVPDALDDAKVWLDRVGRRWDDRLRALRRHVEPRAAPER